MYSAHHTTSTTVNIMSATYVVNVYIFSANVSVLGPGPGTKITPRNDSLVETPLVAVLSLAFV